MKNAINKHLKLIHHPCVAHTLNLTVDDSLRVNTKLEKVLQKCRTIAEHFKHNAVATKKLAQMQVEMNLPTLKIKHDIPTRWKASYTMMERFVHIKIPLAAVMLILPSTPEVLTDDEWEIIEDCVSTLKLIDVMTTALYKEKYTTMSSVIPLVRGLQHALKNVINSTESGELLRSTLLASVAKLLNGYELNQISAKSTFLDPRYKKHAFGSEDNAYNAEKLVCEELEELISAVDLNESSIQIEVVPEEHIENTELLWAYFDDKISNVKQVMSAKTRALIIIRQYLQMPIFPRLSNPLDFWDEHKNLFPELYKLHLKYSCIPATSVPAEQIFTKSGQVNKQRRCRLSPKNLDTLIFLNCNY